MMCGGWRREAVKWLFFPVGKVRRILGRRYLRSSLPMPTWPATSGQGNSDILFKYVD